MIFGLESVGVEAVPAPTYGELLAARGRLKAALREAQDDADQAWARIGWTCAARTVVAG